jgi:alpha-beta hydrolase superfamily lysophospholipase
MQTNPHKNQPVLSAGKQLQDAQSALILIHGRGATAESILTLAQELHHPDFAYLAPQAAGNTCAGPHHDRRLFPGGLPGPGICGPLR